MYTAKVKQVLAPARTKAVSMAVGMFAVTFVAVGLAISSAGTAAARGAPDSFADLAEELLPAVVNIRTTATVQAGVHSGPEFNLPPGLEDFFERFREGQPEQRRRATSLGSGFIIDETGFIVTNNHVVKDAEEIFVVLHDDSELEAEIVGIDDKTDIAVLRVNPKTPLPAVSFGDSDAERVGDWVIAIGNPLGFGGTVTAGIVSARGRDINSGPYDNYIQTDAPINKGNSGGPLFNMEGEVIGINTAIFSPNGGSIGIGFAIPSNLASKVVSQLREYGTTRRGWLGVTIQQVTDEIADSLGLPEASGALVSTVHDDSPAAAAGIKTGDVITSFNSQKVPNSRRLPRMVADSSVGDTVPVEVWRGGEKVALNVKLGQLEKVDLASLGGGAPPQQDQETPRALDSLGLSLAPIGNAVREEFGLSEETEGVVVTKVDPSSDAAEKQLRPGNVIVEVNQEKVSSPDDIAKQIDAVKGEGKKSVLMLVNQNGSLRFVVVKFKQG